MQAHDEGWERKEDAGELGLDFCACCKPASLAGSACPMHPVTVPQGSNNELAFHAQ
jgi:hypothetical protein